jgi:hypothetical protein
MFEVNVIVFVFEVATEIFLNQQLLWFNCGSYLGELAYYLGNYLYI